MNKYRLMGPIGKISILICFFLLWLIFVVAVVTAPKKGAFRKSRDREHLLPIGLMEFYVQISILLSTSWLCNKNETFLTILLVPSTPSQGVQFGMGTTEFSHVTFGCKNMRIRNF